MSSRCRKNIFHKGDLFPAFKETREGQGALLAPAAGQVILIRSNQYIIVRYFGVSCLGPSHCQQEKIRTPENGLQSLWLQPNFWTFLEFTTLHLPLKAPCSSENPGLFEEVLKIKQFKHYGHFANCCSCCFFLIKFIEVKLFGKLCFEYTML